MRILGVDPGSRATGYAILDVEGTTTRFLEGGVLSIPRNASLPPRLGAIGSSLESLVERCRPDEAAVEDLFHALNSKSALTLAHARGVVLGVLARAGLRISEYTPLQVKKAVSGYGFAEKDALRDLVERLLGIPRGLLTRDASDAVAVALCHVQALPMRAAVASAERIDQRAVMGRKIAPVAVLGRIEPEGPSKARTAAGTETSSARAERSSAQGAVDPERAPGPAGRSPASSSRGRPA